MTSTSSSILSPSPSSSVSFDLSSVNSAAAKFRQEQEIVVLNIGGMRFETRRVTLCQRVSMFSAMFGGAFAAPSPDDNGEFFFDRDPTHFRYLLNFLRTGKVFLPPSREAQLELLLEAEYFGIDAVAAAIKRARRLPRHFSLSASRVFEDKRAERTPRLWEGIVADGLLVSLEASNLDLVSPYPPNAVWPDSSGRQRHGTFLGGPADVREDEHSVRALEISSSSGYVAIPLDINPLQQPSLSIEVWIKLLSVPPLSNGWLLGQLGDPLARSITLHDERFGTTAGIGHPGFGVGLLFQNILGPLPLQQWCHLVVAWEPREEHRRGGVIIYLNKTPFHAPVEPRPVQASSFLTLGHPSLSHSSQLASLLHSFLHPSSSAEQPDEQPLPLLGSSHQLGFANNPFNVHCQVAALRVYQDVLTPYQVETNFNCFLAQTSTSSSSTL